ncbi:bifunctional nuclease family protein [Brachyspira hyodysenteriae]|uniref:bifunctional nuclease family protein n=1 Tax=Brachyspira hyodysenteriae TaxID=159 RepID=UPI0022CDBC95|nr:bifunctional nuclease family protein [Brachyspira hyodysenteriae]MCZ9891229.1 bifunctional nuclease family protein [Brachyspira hyodysenteriae]MCZ9988494.1 bifunctional nuclease family protein [Brachyspira hyodysenteriae]MCZ9997136.1 bifunctional nuclease family protein [Brachyspira hyodysenteriae]MDA0000573.1 bifunctional nuclease family protein [Brachyspira hyodysenteriae]MDA0005577.1 bifunctional nuclease family protein [Brachyspira hyodysenteriae]
MVEAKILNLAITDKGFVVILKPEKSDKVVPISIAYLEAQSIMSSLIGYKIERPLTHDIIYSIFQNCSIRLINVIIDNVHADTFFAKLVIEHNGKNIFIDSRPSDAIALSLKSKAPIFIEEHVIEKSGILLEENDNLMKVKEGIPFTYQKFERDELKEKNAENIFVKKEPEEINNADNQQSNINTNNNKKNKEELQKLLDQAVKEERYEDAAKYRDELDNLKE